MVKLGVNIPNFGPTATPKTLRGWLDFAQEGGFSLAMVSDHVAPTSDVVALYPPPFYDPFATLAWMAGMAGDLELGTTVTILPYRHPLLTARMAAAIDHFTAGKFILGVGVGWSEDEYAALGVSFRDRGRITDEHLRAIAEAWTNDVVSLQGEHVSFEQVSTGPRPVRRPHPPIWVGGTSRAAIRRAARLGDAWHPNSAEPAWLRAKGLPALRDEAARSGRPTPRFSPRMRVQVSDTPLGRDRRIGTGTVDQISSDLIELAAMGADYVVLDTNPDHPAARRSSEDDWETLSDVRRVLLEQ